jgi:pimeloyl-ACP methyl ester carboxylesterase
MGFRDWKEATLARLNAGSLVAQTARGAVEYAVAGTGPAVLVVHGRPGGYDQGLMIARILNDPGIRFIAVSRPGYLRTPLETGRSPEDQADALAALLDVLGVSQVAVVAISAGGPPTFQFALRHPERCWGVVLISTRTQRLVRPPLGPRIMLSVLDFSDVAGWLASNLIRCLPPAIEPSKGLVREGVQTFLPYSLRRDGASNDLFQMARLPQYPLSEIRKPALVIHGTADRVVSRSNAEFAASAIPQAQLILVPGAGHGAFFVEHHWLAPKIVEFLKAHSPASRAAAGATCPPAEVVSARGLEMPLPPTDV